MRMFATVCVSGYFDPIHPGHIEYLKNAKLLGDRLVVILNREHQTRSRRVRFNDEERKLLLESIRYVDEVILSIDGDEHVSLTLEKIKPDIFAKGLTASDSEVLMCQHLNIEVVTHVGANVYMQDLLYEFR